MRLTRELVALRKATALIVELIGPATMEVIADALGYDPIEVSEILSQLVSRGRLVWVNDFGQYLYDVPAQSYTDQIREWIDHSSGPFTAGDISQALHIEPKTVQTLIYRMTNVERVDRGIYQRKEEANGNETTG